MPCEQRNSEINVYRGAYRPTQLTLDQMGFSVRDISNRVYTVMGLIPRTSYTLQIAAISEDDSEFPPVILFGPSANVTGVTDVSQGMKLLTQRHVACADVTIIGLFRCDVLPGRCNLP